MRDGASPRPLECFRDLLLDLQRLEAIRQSAPEEPAPLPETPPADAPGRLRYFLNRRAGDASAAREIAYGSLSSPPNTL